MPPSSIASFKKEETAREFPTYKEQARTVRPPEAVGVRYSPGTSDYDVNRLSFYLHCIDNECGPNLIKHKQLLDHPNEHIPPSSFATRCDLSARLHSIPG